MADSHRSLAHKRGRRASDRILNNQALREALSDEQARLLNAWAFEQIEAVVEATLTAPEPEAEAAIEARVTAVGATMQAFNDLLAQLPTHTDKIKATILVETFLNRLAAATDTQPNTPRLQAKASRLLDIGSDLSAEQIFQHLINLLETAQTAA